MSVIKENFKNIVYHKLKTGSVVLVLFAMVAGCETGTNTSDELYDPLSFFLTWRTDPTTTMTIDWHTSPECLNQSSVFHYKKAGTDEWIETTANYRSFPHTDLTIHRVEIRNLEPGTTYRVRFGGNSKEYKFNTMPAELEEPLRFATGGDTDHDDSFRKMNRAVMEFDPEFIVWGGDLAYANADPVRAYRWPDFFQGIKETLVTDEGLITPIVVAIGNHEVFYSQRLIWGRNPHHEHTEEEALAFMLKHNLWDGKPTFFHELFAFPGDPAYGVLDFGDYMSLVILDSNHSTPVAGGQAGWLREIMAERQGVPHMFPVYHVPAYPSHRSYDGTTSTQIREHWVPHFEEYGVRVAFENHDHTYKRTHPIRNGEIAEDGIVYLGDGSWARGPRDGDSKDEWYIHTFAEENHGIIVTLDGDKQSYIMVNNEGVVFDTYENY